MNAIRLLLLSVLTIGGSLGSVAAQVRAVRIPAPRVFQDYAPRNKLEEFGTRLETVLIKGSAYIGTLTTRTGSARVSAVEIRDTGNSTQAAGVEITVNETAPAAVEVRSLIDYEEIDALIRAIDTVAKADDTITKLTHFETRYRTKGDFEVVVFKETPGGVAVAVDSGFLDTNRILLTLDDLTKLRWMIVQAKARLDEIK